MSQKYLNETESLLYQLLLFRVHFRKLKLGGEESAAGFDFSKIMVQ